MLSKQVRAPAISCRYGGEEFVVLLPRTKIEDGAAIAKRLVKQVANHAKSELLSIGVASNEHNSITSVQQLFKAAVQALYQVKSEGRNNFAIA
ncbi:GGDEF domain-containing protein [Colwellia sp. MEBiC06753]